MPNFSDNNYVSYLEQANIKERIAHSLTNIERIIGKTPEVIVLNKKTFEEWFDYCEEKGIDPITFAGIEIIIDPDDPCPYSFIATKNEEVTKKLSK